MKKLSEFKNEEAIDILAELMEPASVICSDRELVNAVRSREPMMFIGKIALKNNKKEVMKVLSIMNETPIDEYECSPISILKDLLILLNDKELVEFFTSQGQKKESNASGSAMGNTEEAEK